MYAWYMHANLLGYRILSMVYLGAFVNALFLMLMAGVFAEGLVWSLLNAFHASKSVIFSGEVIVLLPLAVAFYFVYKMQLTVERDLAAEGY